MFVPNSDEVSDDETHGLPWLAPQASQRHEGKAPGGRPYGKIRKTSSSEDELVFLMQFGDYL